MKSSFSKKLKSLFLIVIVLAMIYALMLISFAEEYVYCMEMEYDSNLTYGATYESVDGSLSNAKNVGFFIACKGNANDFNSPYDVPWTAFRNIAETIGIYGEWGVGDGEAITSIGAYSFYGFKVINYCEIPETVTRIGASAFEGCTSLKEVYIPKSVTSIGQNAFKDCPNIRISGYAGTQAYDYAKANGISFINLCKHVSVINVITKEATNIATGLMDVVCEDCGTVVDKDVVVEKNPSNIDPSFNIGTSTSKYSSSSSLVYSTKQEDVLNSLNLDAKNIIPNMDLGTYQLKSPYVEAFGEKFYFFDVGGKINFDIGDGKVPVSIKVDNNKKTVRMMFGLYNEQTPEDNAHWSQTYNQIKDIYETFAKKKVDTNELWRKFSSVRGKLKKHSMKFLVDTTCTIGGFLEGSFETGNFEFTGGGVFFELGIDGTLDAPLPAPFSLAYAAVGLEVTADGSIQLDYDNEVLSYYVQAEPNMELSAALGVGRPRADFYIEGGIAGNLQAELAGATGIFANRVDTPFKAFLSGNLFVNGVAFGFWEFGKTWEIGDEILLYPRNDDIAVMSIGEGEPVLDAIFESATPLPRDYLNNVQLFAIDDSDKLYSDTGIYPYNAPELTVLPDGNMMLLWVDDLGTKNDANKTSLVYSIYNGETWSEAVELFETGTYNGTPVIYNNGETVHILWNKAKRALADDEGFKELLAEIELYYTCYKNGDFSEPVKITDNSVAELNYNIVENGDSIAIIWAENSDNNPYMSSGTNSIYIKEYKDGVWGEKQLVTSTAETVSEIEVYYANGAANCVYTVVNADGESAIYSGHEQIGNGNCVQFSDGKLYYLDDNCITAYDIETGTAANTSLAGVSNFSISGGNVYALVSNGFTCELYENICTDGEFAEWEQVTEFGKYIRDYSVATDSLGEPVYALNLVDVTDSEIVYGAAELAVCKAADINAIEVGAVYYDNDVVAPSATLPLSIDVYNVGNTAIDSLSVKITDASGNELSSGVVEVSIAAGDVATVTYNYVLPQTLSYYDFTVTVTGSADERNLDNNSVLSSIGYADVVLKDVVIEKTGNGAVASGILENVGYSTSTGVVVDVYDASFPDVILASIECGDISVGGTYSFTYSLPEKYLSLEDKMTMYGLVFDADSDCAEAVYSNNAQKVVFGELTDYTVALIEGEEILTILAVDEFASYTFDEREGYIFKGWYTDEAFSADSKITEIPDDISENILVFAKWIMLGDINEDAVLNVQDVLVALSNLLNDKTDNCHDMNNDDKFNLIDVIKVLKKLSV